ncbi:adenosylcobyric acid synthase (glutamine-hydrolysing) [Melghirimyces profundicolus]|uniref:Cobyric acid synthase n=1 Tax=Melghirimyces profundicolus TaxID=1242148 RepID=A0A2T6C8D3_9BACL|nr:cobyric acid synthase [Melghirimyces profundicolus]PTX64563.1 adenosylcobyric acid synthase (glutamine-hydrolysing) [Melghirimyces profundicolus]
MRLKKCLMFQGTGSDVGKSVLATAFCRMLRQDGHSVAPFKSQNMALNSYVTRDGLEIGRAQGVQAEACGVEATADMNPILIKPSGDTRSQIVVRGKPLGDMDARSYREDFHRGAWAVILDAWERLRKQADVIVIEGAGSPAEINLKDRELVNMRLAKTIQAPVLLVADIDRGGVFAQIVGTMELLEPGERERVVGFLINKFRGDPSLLEPGLRWLEERTGKPVLGVIPFLPDIRIEAEDSVALDHRPRMRGEGERIRMAVIRHPRISNFTDLDPLEREPDVELDYVDRPESLGSPDVIILPGSKNTVEDWLHWSRMHLADAIRRRMEEGARVVGICGGFQMMGEEIRDPRGVESDRKRAEGLKVFPLVTDFSPEKRTLRVRGVVSARPESWASLKGLPVSGYEIHMGITHPTSGREPLLRIAAEGEAERAEGSITPDGRHWGTYLHGIFDNDAFRRSWLNGIRRDKGWLPLEETVRFREMREAAFDRLADHVRQHVDLKRLYRILGWSTERA